MHTKEALGTGEYEQRLNALEEWQKNSDFSERERAALAWTEALTLISENEISDTLYLSLIHISEPTRRTPISYAVFCLKKKKKNDRRRHQRADKQRRYHRGRRHHQKR